MKRGTTLASRYIIREMIRLDVCGISYLAQDTGSGLLVAIQTIPEQIDNDERLLADLHRNFMLLHTLDHPNITKMHALEYDSELCIHFLVQEYAVGVNLLEYRLSKPGQKVGVGDAIEICRQIADALDHAHRSLLHRNIRPDNIILTQEGDVKLWGFGLIPENILRELRLSVGWEYGQPEARVQCYMAPEQLAGLPSTSPASDRWALTVVFYELVSGYLPFDHADSQALVQAICNDIPEIPTELRRPHHRWYGGNQALARAFAKDPGERFPSATAFVNTVDSSPFPRSVGEFRKILITSIGIILLAILSWTLTNIFSSVSPVPANKLPTPTTTASVEERVGVTPSLKKSLLLRVESRPPGASVVLDGKKMGVTPLTVGRVSPGAYHLWLEKQNFKPVDVEIDLTQDTIVSMSLDALALPEPTPQTDELAVKPTEETKEAALTNSVQEDALVSIGEKPLRKEDDNQEENKHRNEQEALLLQEQIRALLQGASKDLEASRLTRPAGKNALNKYQAIQNMDPQNPEAKKGIENIANHLIVLANKHIKAWHLTKPSGRNASAKLWTAITLDPQNSQIGVSVANLIARYIPLTAKTARTPKSIQRLLDQAMANLPEDPNIIAAWRNLSSAKPQAVMNTVTAIPVTPVTPATAEEDKGRTWIEPITELTFAWIDKGCFQMGSTQGDGDEEPVHQVCLDSFWLGHH